MFVQIRKKERLDIFKRSTFIGAALVLLEILPYIISVAIVIYFSLCGYNDVQMRDMLQNDTVVLYTLNVILTAISFVIPFWIFGKICTRKKAHEYMQFAFPKMNSTTFICIAFGIGASMASNFISNFVSIFMETFLGLVPEQPELGGAIDNPQSLGIALLCTAAAPAFIEEFAFRGVTLSILRKFGDMPAIIITALLFGLMHGNFVQIPFAFGIGLALGLITVITDSIWPAVAVHFANNAIAVTFEYLGYMPFGELISVLIFYGLIALGIVMFIKLLKKGAFKRIKKAPSTMGAAERAVRMILSPTVIIATIMFIMTALQYVSAA